MPELPEVETIRAGLESGILGRTLTGVELYHPRVARRSENGEHGIHDLVGSTVHAVVRRGKYMWIDFGQPLVVHLGMSGQLLIHDGRAPRGPHTRAVLDFSGRQVSFVDQRTFGHLQRSTYLPGDGHPAGYGSERTEIPASVAHIARDLLDPWIHLRDISATTRRKRTEIKRVMLDQTVVSGLGNIYCDEALFRAGIHPRRKASGLSYISLETLWRHGQDVMRDALDQGGTSFDALYVNVNGASGYFDRSLNAYGRGGKPCLRCGTTMQKIEFMNRSSTFCPTCQPYSG